MNDTAIAMASLPPVTLDMMVVFFVVFLAIVLFIAELFPVDATALLLLVTLVLLEPWSGISPEEGVSGFSNPATLTVLAMLILSEAIRQTGLVQILGDWLADYAGNDRFKQLLSTIVVGGAPSGFINNTPVVAMLVPVIADLARKGKSSPSKLLMPLSFASMLGGMLTLIGTSTNILASNVSTRLLGRGFSMFEFTHLGFIILLVGCLYLLLIGHRLLPEHVKPEETYIEEYEVEQYLTEFTVGPDFQKESLTVQQFIDEYEGELDVLMLMRDGKPFMEPLDRKAIRSGDRIMVRTNFATLHRLLAVDGLLPGAVSEGTGEELTDEEQNIVEVVVTAGSSLVGQTLRRADFLQGYDAHILAYRSGGEILHQRLEQVKIRPGDTLLLHTTQESLNRLSQQRDIIATREAENPQYKEEKIPFAIAVMFGVVGLAALNILPILVTSLMGVIAMVVGGVVQLSDIYDKVDWSVFFLLAGVIPLGMALEQSGGAEWIGELVARSALIFPSIVVLWLFYMITGLLTNIISNNASVVLMLPVGIEAAQQVGANPFAFVLAVTFAASTAFLSPIGYQTNLFIYGPGGYQIRDYVIMGAPLQILLSLVTVAGIAVFWGI